MIVFNAMDWKDRALYIADASENTLIIRLYTPVAIKTCPSVFDCNFG